MEEGAKAAAAKTQATAAPFLEDLAFVERVRSQTTVSNTVLLELDKSSRAGAAIAALLNELTGLVERTVATTAVSDMKSMHIQTLVVLRRLRLALDRRARSLGCLKNTLTLESVSIPNCTEDDRT